MRLCSSQVSPNEQPERHTSGFSIPEHDQADRPVRIMLNVYECSLILLRLGPLFATHPATPCGGGTHPRENILTKERPWPLQTPLRQPVQWHTLVPMGKHDAAHRTVRGEPGVVPGTVSDMNLSSARKASIVVEFSSALALTSLNPVIKVSSKATSSMERFLTRWAT